MTSVPAPKNRSDLRLQLGKCWYGAQRRLLWIRMRRLFARDLQADPLPHQAFAHQTLLLRQLKDVDIDPKQFARVEAIILSMTPAEREKPALMNPSRKRRIAAGCGQRVEDVNRLLKQYESMRQMMKQLKRMGKGGKGGKGRKMPGGFPGGMPGGMPGGFPGMGGSGRFGF